MTTGGMAGHAAMSESSTFLDVQGTGNRTSYWTSLASVMHAVSTHQIRHLGGIFMYGTSRWALTCMSVAIILNRTRIYASARRRVTLSWMVRLGLRIIPIVLFLSHAVRLLQAIRCQTSPDFHSMRYGDHEDRQELDFAGGGGALFWLSSKLLFSETVETSCRAVDMIPPVQGNWEDKRGSMALLWPLFQALCIGQFVETLSCAVQGRQMMTETGMSIFEHSLAFAEAEGMLANLLGLTPFNFGQDRPETETVPTDKIADQNSLLMTRKTLFRQLNTPPESLLMGLISSMNNLSSQILGVLDLQAQYRLVSTGFWGICFMGAFIWGFYSNRLENGENSMILRFPTVCLVGFIPHLLILLGIVLCALVYGMALLLCFLSPPREIARRGIAERIRWAKENMQANTQASGMQLHMHEDFYTALVKVGFTILTAASEVVYLHEWHSLNISVGTWLENDRLRELDAINMTKSRRTKSNFDAAKSSSRKPREQNSWKSGYAISQTVKAVKQGQGDELSTAAAGVGHRLRGSRYIKVYEFFHGIYRLLSSWFRLALSRILTRFGILARPRWLFPSHSREEQRMVVMTISHLMQRLREQSSTRSSNVESNENDNDNDNDNDDDDDDDDFEDIETEIRNLVIQAHGGMNQTLEKQLSANLYEWWKAGGWWGDRDESGTYVGSDDESVADDHSKSYDEDDASLDVVSVDTGGWTTETETDISSMASGQTTPTNAEPAASIVNRRRTRRFQSTDELMGVDPAQLATLLDPQDAETRAEARMLAYHLRADTITTRSQYHSARFAANLKLISSNRYMRPPTMASAAAAPLSPDEEAQVLEQIILTRRAKSQKGHSSTVNSPSRPDPATTAERMGKPSNSSATAPSLEDDPSGVQCVVCQTAPRTILVWPCRCLSLCEDCRVNLAMNNFAACVCCRQEVAGFSRIYMP